MVFVESPEKVLFIFVHLELSNFSSSNSYSGVQCPLCVQFFIFVFWCVCVWGGGGVDFLDELYYFFGTV